jgi:predicted ATP-dependent endonuclease of OLD family
MITKIKIQRFRGFKELECTVAPTTVLMGPNSSGKTTVLHAIRVAYEILQLAAKASEQVSISDAQITFARPGLIESPTSLLPLADWKAFFLDQKVGQKIAFEIRITFEDSSQIQDLNVNVGYANNNQLKYMISLHANGIAEVLEGLPAGSTKERSVLGTGSGRGCPKQYLFRLPMVLYGKKSCDHVLLSTS